VKAPDLRGSPWFRVKALNVTVNETGPFHRFKRHQHLRHELIAVERGVYEVAVNGEPLKVSPLSLLIVNPGDWHEDVFSPPMRYVALGMSLVRDGASESAEMRLLRTGLPASAHSLRLDKALFKPMLDRLVSESLAKDPISGHVIEALMTDFVLNVIRALPQASVSEDLLELLRGAPEGGLQIQLARLFERRLSGHYGVPEMAHDLGMSESSLAHRCKTELGMPPALAFSRHKMLRAMELLKRTQMSVKEISDFLGFNNPYHFSKVFKRIHRQSPASVRD